MTRIKAIETLISQAKDLNTHNTLFKAWSLSVASSLYLEICFLSKLKLAVKEYMNT